LNFGQSTDFRAHLQVMLSELVQQKFKSSSEVTYCH